MADEAGHTFSESGARRIVEVVRRVEADPRFSFGDTGERGPSVRGKVTHPVQIASTTIAASITAGTRTVTPASMLGIAVGAVLVIDTGGSQESVTVTAVTSTTFTAVFANSHTGPGIAVVSGTASGRYTGSWYLHDPVADTFAQQAAQIWIKSPNGQTLTGGRFYRGYAAGEWQGAMTFDIEDAALGGGGSVTISFAGINPTVGSFAAGTLRVDGSDGTNDTGLRIVNSGGSVATAHMNAATLAQGGAVTTGDQQLQGDKGFYGRVMGFGIDDASAPDFGTLTNCVLLDSTHIRQYSGTGKRVSIEFFADQGLALLQGDIPAWGVQDSGLLGQHNGVWGTGGGGDTFSGGLCTALGAGGGGAPSFGNNFLTMGG